jgi:undecaprenyl-diphosphatase
MSDGHAGRRAPDPFFFWAAAAFVALTGLAVLVAQDRFIDVDTSLILALRSFESPPLTKVMSLASTIANGRVAIPVTVLLTILIYRFDERRAAVMYLIACATGEGVMLGIKEIVHHHRPVALSPKLTDAGWYSFPSGHAMLAVIIFGLGTWLVTRRAPMAVRVLSMTAAATFILLVGVSRVYLGAHWPSDVVGAYLGGIGWTALCYGFHRRREVSAVVTDLAAPEPAAP